MSDEARDEDMARDAILARFPDAADALRAYVQILGTRGIEWGLLGPREGSKLWSRHVANSLALVDIVAHGADVADVGSGAGLPGLPVAIVRPDLHVTLVEPLLRRATFLCDAVDELGLGQRVRVARARAEDLDERFDVVMARAVANLSQLLDWTIPLLLPSGQLLALKGSSAPEEVAAAGSRLRRAGLRAEVLEVRAAPAVEGTRAVRVSRGL